VRTRFGERRDIKKEALIMPVGKKFEDMTQAERQVAFEHWVEGKTARRAKSTVKRDAIKALIKAHQDEYNALVKQGGSATAKKGR